MLNLKKKIDTIIINKLSKLGYLTEDALVTQSNRPDLSDYQSNISMKLAKTYKKSPILIANEITAALKEAKELKDIRVDGPGFINISVNDDLLLKSIDLSKDRTGAKVIIDYGGPNIAKEMHVGHLRSAVIGESVKRIMRAYGDDVISDVHFGDWGTPIGMLISQLELEQRDFPYFDKDFDGHGPVMGISDISALYRRAAVNFKESDSFKEKARIATSDLQNGHKGYLSLWRMLRDVSLKAVKKNYKNLGVDFDLWLGESDVNDLLPFVLEDLQKKNMAILSDGAVIVPLSSKNGRDRAPLILKKTDGAYTYAATDLATMIKRCNTFNPDAILFVVDARQHEHFEQVFEVAKLAGYVKPKTSLEHIAFGTVNGKDGRPFKTRAGGVMNLEDLIDLSVDKAKENIAENDGSMSWELNTQAQKIAIGALKYQDLKNNRVSDYIFDTENFTKSEGKTGAYIQYAIARINSILSKNEMEPKQGHIIISNQTERELLLLLNRQSEALEDSYTKRDPSVISEYVYTVAQKFSTFYTETNVSKEPDALLKYSRLKILSMTKDVLTYNLDLLGIEALEKMFRARHQSLDLTRKITGKERNT